MATARVRTPPKRAAASKRAPAKTARDDGADGIAITHGERIVYPSAKLTKQDVVDYYRAVAPLLLPDVVRRPLSLVRCPGGAERACFFQKHPGDTLGPHVRALELAEKSGESDTYLYIEEEAGLVELAQMNAIELHPWGARIDDPERPDRLVFDLDPGPGVDWKTLVAAAREVRERLRREGVESFVRLSGGKGVHVVAPIRPGPGWDAAKAFCERIADAMAADAPDRYIATASKAKRNGLIFIDWLRNARGATSVASWSLRARKGAPVVVPLTWNDLGRTTGSQMFGLAAARRRAARLRGDPWQGFHDLDQPLP